MESDPRLHPKSASELVVPVYLDVPMTVSLVAALEGGVAYGSTTTSTSHDARAAEAAAKGGVSLPVISSLLRLDLSGQLQGKLAAEAGQQIQVERQHTAASLFNLLRSRLEELSLITPLPDATAMGAARPGQLVVVSGRIVSDPVLQLSEALAELAGTLKDVMEVAALGRLLEGLVMVGINQSDANADPNSRAGLELLRGALTPQKPQLDTQRTGNQKRKGTQPARADADVQPNSAGFELVEQATTLLVKIRDDLRRSPVTDLLVAGPGFSALATLTRSYLEPQSTELMKGSDMAVLGKVSRVVTSQDERIDLLRRSILKYLSPAAADKAYSILRSRKFLNLELVELVVQPPAVQLIPLAVYV